jgi:hypothetical protein
MMTATSRSPDLKARLWQELALKAELITDGVAITQEALDLVAPGVRAQEQVHNLFEMDFETHDFELPSGFDLPHGLSVGFRWNARSAHVIAADGDRTILVRDGNELAEVSFHKRPSFYGRTTSDGQEMGNVAALYRHRALFVAYSNECSYKDRGEDCAFCNINHTKDVYGEKDGIFWKTPQQIGEVAAAALAEGVIDHITISGGVIPERRELEYYLDVADAIQSHTGLDDFNGTAVVAAPLDLRHIDRFREAGYRTTAMNIEIWDRGYYDTICPGKARGGGGWDHWLTALKHAAKVFGHGNVRSNMVAGLEPKRKTLEGLEHLAAAGVVGTFTVWCPNPGSELEGHRAPQAGWYLDLAEKTTAIWKKNGFTFQQVSDSCASNDTLQHDIWRIQDELLPVFASPASVLAEHAA